MADIFPPEKRSQIMSRIRGKNTGPERIVFRFLRRRRIYFQRHYRRAPGCPDIALPRKKRAVFIDGDFWHGRDFERRRARLEHAGQRFWIEKIERNMRRDAATRQALEEQGWRILRVWEREIVTKKYQGEALEQVAAFLAGDTAVG